MRHFSKVFFLFAALVGLVIGATLFASFAYSEVAVPPLTGRIVDLTGTLSLSQSNEIADILAAHEQKSGNQLGVLIVPTTQPEAIEQYSLRVVESWKLGRKGVDDGALFLVAKNDRKLRIEVGYGLEGVLPDAICRRIISEIITPKFKQGDFAGGITAGVTAIIDAINKSGEFAPGATGSVAGSPDLFFLIFFAIFFFVFVFIAAALGKTGQWQSGGSGWRYSSGGNSDGGGFSGGGGSFGGGGASGSW